MYFTLRRHSHVSSRSFYSHTHNQPSFNAVPYGIHHSLEIRVMFHHLLHNCDMRLANSSLVWKKKDRSIAEAVR